MYFTIQYFENGIQKTAYAFVSQENVNIGDYVSALVDGKIVYGTIIG